MSFKNQYDVIVVGAGHAGCEAALATARLGMKTLLTTINMDRIAFMDCNPAVGGPAKSHLVKEIDALGGEMALNADRACVQARMLNRGKGPAVHALRMQSDKNIYHQCMKQVLENQENLALKQLMIEEIIIEAGSVQAVKDEYQELHFAKCIILATGTYLGGKIIVGDTSYVSGPGGQRAAEKLTFSLKKAGLEIMRFKTGTPARVDARTIDFSKMTVQEGEKEPLCFSFLHKAVNKFQKPCFLTYTNEKTHEVIKANLHRAPLYTGNIEGTGPRYCPSIEDKVMRFKDKEAHQAFIEPEGFETNEMYVQGMSSSLPIDVQRAFLRTMAGLESVEIIRAGYAIEYDCIDPLQLKPTLECKKINGLFSAGQSNGTSGYEEAAAQGLMAGINAVKKILKEEPFLLSRQEAYIGVLLDDLVTKGTHEPYRLMTSRAEYRLVLRQDNADLRLTKKGYQLGLVNKERWEKFCQKKEAIEELLNLTKETYFYPNEKSNQALQSIGTAVIQKKVSFYDLLKRQELCFLKIASLTDTKMDFAQEIIEQVEIMAKYEGYIKKQFEQVERVNRLEAKKLPLDFDYESIQGLSLEARQKLNKIKPLSLGQASRISGVSPADIAVLLVKFR